MIARSMQVTAQAKINLRLRVLAREDGGYHQIETLFLRIALADTVRVRRTPGTRSLDVGGSVDLSALGPVERNLAWRAAEAHMAASGGGGGFSIEIDKHIPIGGGLGGGSADAGAVLRALDAVADVPLGETRLLEIATTLGADVPFLTSEMPYALAWGRGERMLALAPPPERTVSLFIPAFSIATADAYQWLAESRVAGAPPRPVRLDVGGLSDWASLASVATNDFESVVESRHPELAVLKTLRTAGPVISLMSGSGSAIFCIAGETDGGDLVRGATGGWAPILTRTCTHVEPPSPIE